MLAEEPPAEGDRPLPEKIRPGVRPHDFRFAIVREQTLQGLDVCTQRRRIRWAWQPRGCVRVLRHRIVVQVDYDVVTRCDVREQQQERVVGGDGLVRVIGDQREMMRGNLAEAQSACGDDRLRLCLEAPCRRLRDGGLFGRLLDHHVQGAAAAQELDAGSVRFSRADEILVIESARVDLRRRHQHDLPRARGVHGCQSGSERAWKIRRTLVDDGVNVNVHPFDRPGRALQRMRSRHYKRESACQH